MQESFIARQPILSSNGEIIGYELLFRTAQSTESANFSDESEAGEAILANMLSNFGQDWLLGGKKAFINVAESSLNSEFIELLEPSQTVFEITPATIVTDSLLEKVQALKQDGFTFALDDCAMDPSKVKLHSSCSYVKIDCQRTGMLGLTSEVNRIKKLPPFSKIQIIASKIESAEEQKHAQSLGCELFQGFYFEKPQTLKSKNLSPNAAALIQILNLTRKEADITLIESAFKKDVATSLRLLRYINSAGFGLRTEITSFKHAVQILGYQKLTRWILLLLATSNKDSPPALAKSAISRGRFMELVGKQTLTKEDADNLFITGAFSFLDALLGVDLETVLPELGLPEPVTDALLNHTGIYYPFLMLAIATERDMPQMQQEQAMLLGISAQNANKALIEATAWSESFSQ